MLECSVTSAFDAQCPQGQYMTHIIDNIKSTLFTAERLLIYTQSYGFEKSSSRTEYSFDRCSRQIKRFLGQTLNQIKKSTLSNRCF